MGSKRFFGRGGSKHANTQVISMTSTPMKMPAPDSEHKTPLWCVMFKNQVVSQQPGCEYIQPSESLQTRKTSSDLTELRQAKCELLLWRHPTALRPRGDRIAIFRQLEVRRHVSCCVFVCVDMRHHALNMLLTFHSVSQAGKHGLSGRG